MRTTHIRAVAAVAAVAFALTACGSSDTEEQAQNDPAPSNRATGEPVLLGFVNTDEGALAAPEITTAAKAAADYLNDNGGINGRPVELVTCSTNGSPESSSKCANELISKKVVAVLEGVDLGADAKLKPLKEASIPLFGVYSVGPALAADPGVTFTSAPLPLLFGGLFKILADKGSKKPVFIAPDVGPAFKDQVEKQLLPGAKAAGLDMTALYYNPASPDFAAAVTAAKKQGADAIYLSGDETACTNGVKTARQLGWDQTFVAGTCTQFIKAVGSQAEGVNTISFVLPPGARESAPAPKQEQIDIYLEGMEAAGAADKANSLATYGFATVMTAAEALKKVTGELTAATAAPALLGYQGDVFLGGTVDCTKRPIPGAFCGTQLAGLEVNEDGTQELLGGDFLDIGQG